MKKNRPKIVYDKESKVFSIEMSAQKSVDSDIQQNVVIDYDKNGNIVRVNIYEIDFDNFRNGHSVFKEFRERVNLPVFVK